MVCTHLTCFDYRNQLGTSHDVTQCCNSRVPPVPTQLSVTASTNIGRMTLHDAVEFLQCSVTHKHCTPTRRAHCTLSAAHRSKMTCTSPTSHCQCWQQHTNTRLLTANKQQPHARQPACRIGLSAPVAMGWRRSRKQSRTRQAAVAYTWNPCT